MTEPKEFFESYERYENELKVVIEYIEAHCKISGMDANTQLKHFFDPFSRIEVLSEIAGRLGKRINWEFDFRNLKTPASFLEALI